MTRHLAHFINLDGHTYPMSVAEISDDGRECRILPFGGEIHSTRFHNGSIAIIKNAGGCYEIKECREMQKVKSL